MARVVIDQKIHMGNITETRHILGRSGAEVGHALKYGIGRQMDAIRDQITINHEAYAMICYHVGELAVEMAKAKLTVYGEGTHSDVHIVTGSLMDAVTQDHSKAQGESMGKKRSSARISVIIDPTAGRYDKSSAVGQLASVGGSVIQSGEPVATYKRLPDFVSLTADIDMQGLLLESLGRGKAKAIINIYGKNDKASLASIILELETRAEQLRQDNLARYNASITARVSAASNKGARAR